MEPKELFTTTSSPQKIDLIPQTSAASINSARNLPVATSSNANHPLNKASETQIGSNITLNQIGADPLRSQQLSPPLLPMPNVLNQGIHLGLPLASMKEVGNDTLYEPSVEDHNKKSSRRQQMTERKKDGNIIGNSTQNILNKGQDQNVIAMLYEQGKDGAGFTNASNQDLETGQVDPNKTVSPLMNKSR